MKIYNELKTQELKEYDLKKGYLKEDKIIIKTHEAQKEVEEIVAEYPNGGKDVKIVIDTPYQPAKDAWNEYEDIQIYIPFSQEQLKEQKISELKQRLSQLSEDIIQSTAGEIIDDIDSRKAEFVRLHNELRVLLGKSERKVEKVI